MPAILYKKILLLCCLCLLLGCGKKREAEEAQTALKVLEASDKMTLKQRRKVLDSMYSSLDNCTNDSLNRLTLCRISWRYFDDGEYDMSKKIANRICEMAEQKSDSSMMAYGNYYLGDYYFNKTVLDSSLYHYLKAEKLYLASKDTINAGRAIQSTVTVLYFNGSYAETEVQAIKALRLFQQLDHSELIYDAYMALGLTLNEMGNTDKSLEYYNLALDQIKRMEREKLYDEKMVLSFRVAVYNDIGKLYDLKKDYKTAISYYDKGLAIKNVKSAYTSSYCILRSNRAFAQLMDKTPKATVKKDLFEALRIRDSLNHKMGIISSQIHLGRYYLTMRDTTTGLTYLKDALSGARAVNSSSDVKQVLSLLTVNDRKNTTSWSQEYFRVTDSLQQAERATRNKFARIEYETERIEKQNKLLSRQFKIIVVACIILVVFIIGLFIIIRLRSKNRELRHAREQQKANEKIYTLLMQQETDAENAKVAERNRLAMELHDGILNRIFTTRFNLSTLETTDDYKKQLLVQELQDTQEEIRRLSHDLKESFLAENESFIGALKDLVQKQQDATGPVFDLYIDKFINWGGVTPETRVAIFRIIQEASTNAKKHAQAQNCNIALMAQGETLKLRIWDDGRGFETKKEKQGIGLKNIADRIKALGGSFTLNSTPGGGTVLEILV